MNILRLQSVTRLATVGAVLWLGACSSPTPAKKAAVDGDKSQRQPSSLRLTTAGKPASAVVTLTPIGSAPLVNRAVEVVAGTVKRWSGVDLPVAEIKPGGRLPKGPGIVLTTFDELRAVAPEIVRANSTIGKVKTADEQGFAIAPVGDQVFVVARSVRGVYNGAVYLRDFLMDGPADQLVLNAESLLRAPVMKGRPAYVLSIWGNEQEYTAADWGKIFQAFSRDGIDRVYFWVSGHFPSKKFPQTYKAANPPWDTTANTRIGTIADLRAIMKHAHDSGMKFYLGGGMGGWVGTWLITNKKPGTMKTGPGEAPYSLCPTHPESRASLKAYYEEMYDALPEADGLYIELCDEFGECRCADCSKPIDNLGSKQFGRSLLTLAREIAEDARRKHPQAKCAFTVGYDEHAHDPLFYRMMREMGDEHYEWMEARNRWEFTGPDGQDRPAAYFSGNVMKWKQWYNKPLDLLVSEANKAARVDFHGLITSFEPGYASGSFYKTIPFPTDQLPYILTGFAYHEMTWTPTLSMAELKQRARARFFGADASIALADDFWTLREIIRQFPAKGKMPAARVRELARISTSVEAAWPTASPKTRAGLELMRKAITDIQQYQASRN